MQCLGERRGLGLWDLKIRGEEGLGLRVKGVADLSLSGLPGGMFLKPKPSSGKSVS